MSSSLVLDGAAGTYLESKGISLHPKLWSSGALLTPEGQAAIRQLHQAYISSQADVITSVTYQASIPGFVDAGLSAEESDELITKGVAIAREEANRYNSINSKRKVRVAAGLGPYGAYLSNGEEYTGNYGLKFTKEEFDAFWLPRVKAALKGEPDYLLFETIPNFNELESIILYAAPLGKQKQIPVWVSLSLNTTGNEITLADGTPISKVSELVKAHTGVIDLIGANCFDVSEVPRVLDQLSLVGLPLIIYPNSGEIYDGHSKQWSSRKRASDNEWQPQFWASRGAAVIGGCCRTSPAVISQISQAVNNNAHTN